ncbi:nitrate- and nitrite sensing domain-containing protein [Streptomyces sp. WAC06614]|uniref:sensor histidine kinase n=1 Tax=Streptomyces sp. WAC06614 TaxID=2487416 RepID=UPI00163C0C40|nr:nitrate- and nitrite sensing domain-containing protein [Streptomyces sp. WAC06614]
MSTPFRSRRRVLGALAPPSGRTPVLGRLSVPTRMLAVLLIPLIAAVVLAGLRVGDSLDQRDRYDRLHRIAQLSQSGTTLLNDLQRERDLLIDPQAKDAAGAGALQSQQERTSVAAQSFVEAARKIPSSNRLDEHIKAIEGAVGTLAALRQQADKLSAGQVNSAYLRVLMPVIGVNNELAGDLDQSYSPGWATYTLALDTAMTWSERALISNAARSGALSHELRAALLSSARLQEIAAQEFRLNAMAADTATYNRLVDSPDVAAANEAVKAVGAAPTEKLSAGALPPNWYQAFTKKITDLQQLQSTVGQRLVDDFAQSRSDQESQAYEDLFVALLILAAALLLAYFVSRSILRGLRTLESSAVEVAENRLPAAMNALTSGKARDAELHVASVAGTGRDEFAAVGRAVDRLHREAVRLAAGQARLRENVAAIFRNLAHRNQSLVQRQLRLITDLERDEPDPQQLARLFQLDHLATRMRRNSENLLVLAGAELGSRTVGPMLLHDAVRSAISEVEQYQRIVVHTLPETAIKGEAVRDVVHLIAELLENAVSFSSPHTDVTVDSQRLPDRRQVLEICDRGIGMSPEQLAEANRILVEGPQLDVSISEQLGLYVVGTLSQRHGIRVTLRASSPGISTLVILPAELIHTGAVPGHGPQPADRHVPAGPALGPGGSGGSGGQSGSGTPALGSGGPAAPSAPSAPPVPQASPAPAAPAGPAEPALDPGPVPVGPYPSGPPLRPVPGPGSATPAVDPVDPPTAPIPMIPAAPSAPAAPSGVRAQQRPWPGGPGVGGGEPDGGPRSPGAPVPPTSPAALPRRVPQAHLIPGALDTTPGGTGPRDPEQVRSRLSGFQSSSVQEPDGRPERD